MSIVASPRHIIVNDGTARGERQLRRRRHEQLYPDPSARYELAQRAIAAWLMSGAMKELETADAHLIKTISMLIPDGKTVSDPALAEDYRRLMRCDSQTIKRSSDRLVGLGRAHLLEGGMGCKYLRFALPDLAAPLLVAAGAPSLNSLLRGRADPTCPTLGQLGSQTHATWPSLGQVGATSPNLGQVTHAGEIHTFFSHREVVAGSPTCPRLPEQALLREARLCLEDFVTSYTEHRGALYLGHEGEDVEILCDLLFDGHTRSDLQLYTLGLMTVTAAHRQPHCKCDRCWVANSDRGVRVLRHCLATNKRLGKLLHLVAQRGAVGVTNIDPASLWQALRAHSGATEAIQAIERAGGGVLAVHGRTVNVTVPREVHDMLEASGGNTTLRAAACDVGGFDLVFTYLPGKEATG